MAIYDVHCHLHEYSEEAIGRILEEDRELIVVAVSDDLESAMRTVSLGRVYPERVIPCVGFHPWSIRDSPLTEAEEVLRMAYRSDVRCIGEVGLDQRFLPSHTMTVQQAIFRGFLRLAREIDAFVNIHAPNSWRKAVSMALEEGVSRAVIHWYTGPLDLATNGVEYKVSINPAVRIQEKHRTVAANADIGKMVFESDAPYNYRGLELSPSMVREAIRVVANIRGVPVDELERAASRNSERLIYG